MKITFDAAKDAANWRKHGLSLEEVDGIDWSLALSRLDRRNRHGEWRIVSIAPLRGRLHVVVSTDRCGVLRVISLRKANIREIRWYAANF
jgi:uncharacterized protein